ncbi:Ig-like domain-containing protein [Anaerocolumna aminovalerica]|uniref:Ig-like domain-containing protein n=1 Tax=Anaerocolumna aminovalerica TaxID=1527 RepID=UPI000BE28D2E|nr:Ig-like domain-containing protein [Anaerocolumna aminovalerica]
MKKNFFKKLASGLALAMVVTSFAPAAPAFAAAATKIVEQGGKKAPQTVYVGKKVDYSLNNVYKTNTYKWFTSNAKIAKITQTGGIVTPVAPGKATIKVNAYKKSTGKLIKAFKLDLDVKLRATSVNIGAEDFELAVGEKKDLDAVKTPANSTDTLRYFSSNEKVATVDTKTGIVTAVAAGEATIKVASKGAWFTANNSKYNKYDEVKVTVVDGLLSVKQTAANKLSLTFSKDVSETLKASDFAIEEVSTHSVQAVKGLSFSNDGKTVTLETYLSFADKKEYKLTYDEKAFNFTASVGEVASIALKTTKVVFGEETKVEYTLFDANGIDITSIIDASRVTMDVDTKTGYSTDDGKITLYNKGDVANVTLTYHTWTYKDGEEVTVSVKGTIVAVDASEITFGTYEKYTIAKDEPANWDKVTPNTRIALDDYGYRIFVRVKGSNDEYVNNDDIKYSSSNGDVLAVDADGKLYPIKKGSVYVIATTGKTSWTLPVTVSDKRTVASIAVDKGSVTVSNSKEVTGGDKARIEVTVNDQYGVKIPDAEILVTPQNSKLTPPSHRVEGTTIIFNGLGADAGTHGFTIEAGNKRYGVTVRVLEVNDKASTTYQPLLSTNNMDTVIYEDTELASKNITISVGKYKGGVLHSYMNMKNVTVYKPNGDVLVTGAGIETLTVETTPQASGSAIIKKLPTGRYKVVAKFDNEITNKVDEKTSYFTIRDTQVLPTVKVEKLTIDTIGTPLDAAVETLKVRDANGNELPIQSAKGKVLTNQVLIETITVINKVGDHHEIETTLTLNKPFYLK